MEWNGMDSSGIRGDAGSAVPDGRTGICLMEGGMRHVGLVGSSNSGSGGEVR